MIPVEGYSNLYRDENTGAIINCDNQAYTQYINMKRIKELQKIELQQIKNEIDEIKSLLKEIINESKRN